MTAHRQRETGERMVLEGNRRGMVAILAAMALYTLNDTFVKLTTDTYPTGQILAIRGGFSTIVVVSMVLAAGALPRWRTLGRPVVGLRACLEIATAATSIAALALMPIANVTAIMMASPLIVTAVVVATGMEPPRRDRILAALVGFAGVVLVLRPDVDAFGPAALLALACAGCLAGRDLVTRRMPAEIPSVLIALATTAAAATAGLVMGLVETWSPLSLRATLYLAAAAVFAAFGNYALIVACRGVDLSVVTPFRYSIILWAVAAGFLVWGQVPDAVAALGMAAIAGAGFYSVRQDRKRAEACPAPPAEPLEVGARAREA